jgi:hypothetical protein
MLTTTAPAMPHTNQARARARLPRRSRPAGIAEHLPVRKAMGRKVLQQLGEDMAAAKATAPADPLTNQSARA